MNVNVVEAEPRMRPWEWAALVLLLVGPFLLMVGWLVGVWLLWTSNRWTRVWKVLGTVAWPTGWLAALGGELVQAPLWLCVLIAGVVEMAFYLALFNEAQVKEARG